MGATIVRTGIGHANSATDKRVESAMIEVVAILLVELILIATRWGVEQRNRRTIQHPRRSPPSAEGHQSRRGSVSITTVPVTTPTLTSAVTTPTP